MVDPRRRVLFAVKALLVGGAGALVLVAWRRGLFTLLGEPEHLRQVILDSGAWGWLAFLAIWVVLQPLGLPGIGLVIGSSLVWPPATALTLSMIGGILACIVGFSVSRFVARDWVAARIPPNLRRHEAALEARAFRTVLILRVAFTTSPLLHGLFGLSRVPFGTHLVASVIGFVPTFVAVVLLGRRLFDFLRSLPGWALALIPVCAVGLTIGLLLRRPRAAAT